MMPLPLDIEDVSELADAELVDALRLVSVLRNRVAALELALVGEAASRSTDRPAEESIARAHGCRNVTEFLQRTTLTPARRARSLVRLSEALRPSITLTGEAIPAKCPAVADSIASGAISPESATLITDLIQKSTAAHPDDLQAAEEALVGAASYSPDGETSVGGAVHADQLRVMCNVWHEALDPDGAEPNEEEILRRRAVNLSAERRGLVSISGQLLPEVAATLARLFDAIGNPRASSNAASVESVVESERTGEQKRHDMLASILNVASRSSEMPTQGGAPITVVIQTTAEDMESGDRPGLLQDHEGTLTPVSSHSVRHGACSGAVQYIRQNRSGRILEISTAERVFTANQRRAISVRDGSCVIPGCHTPPTWCEVHHVTPHSTGGKTHTDNGVLLCYFHHRTIDTNGWEISMVEGVPRVNPPPWIRRHPKWPDLPHCAA